MVAISLDRSNGCNPFPVRQVDYFKSSIPLQLFSRHVLNGLCKILGYEVLNHGTSYSNYRSILRSGVDLSRSGSTTRAFNSSLLNNGGDEGLMDRYAKNAQGYFYVFRGTEIGLDAGERRESYVICCIIRLVSPIMHSYLAYAKEYLDKKGANLNLPVKVSDLKANPSIKIPLARNISFVAKALFTPKLRFIYHLDEVHQKFEDDPDYDYMAYRTSHSLPSDRIGLIGLMKHGRKEHFLKQIRSHPGRVVQGVAQLGLGVLLTATGLGLFI